MKNLSYSIVLFSLLMVSCQKEMSIDEVEIIKDDPIVLFESEINGRVIDQNNIPVADALVMAGNLTDNSKQNGHFSIGVAEVGEQNGMISSDIQGYFMGINNQNFRPGGDVFVEITMIEKTNTQTILPENLEEGYQLAEDAEIDFLNSSFKDQSGRLYDGPIRVSGEYLDPNLSDFKNKMPGSLTTLNEGGEVNTLDPLALLMLDMETESGESLELGGGDSMQLSIKIPPGTEDNAPTEAEIYLYDLEKERWVKNGKCIKNGGVYTGYCYRPGYYVICKPPTPSICLSGTIFNPDSLPSSFVKVIVEDLTTNFVYFGYADRAGYFCGSVPLASNLQLTIEDHCQNILHTEAIGAFSDDFELEDLYLETLVNDYIINISGLASHCISTSIDSGHIAVTYPGKIRAYPISDSQFDFDMGLKCTSFPELEIRAYDLENKQRSLPLEHQEFADLSISNIEVCEELDDFFMIDFEGKNYMTAPTQFYPKDNSNSNWYVLKGLSADLEFQLDLKAYQAEGNYTSDVIFTATNEVDPLNLDFNGTASPDITLVITLDDGEYIEGNFTGTIMDNFGQAKPISSLFRIRKKQ